MKYLFFLICFTCVLHLHAQERRNYMGLVESKESLLKNVHIKNISSGKYAVSGEDGMFRLQMRFGDTLVLSHVGMEDLIKFLKPSDLEDAPLIFMMTPSSEELREVVINDYSEINAVSLGIIQKRVKKLSVNERRLKTAGDFKPVHLLGLLTGSLPLDPILNAINGRTKMLKRNIGYEKREKYIAFLEINYYDYMQKNMNLSEQEIRFLILQVIEEAEFVTLMNSENTAKMEFFLEDQWLIFNKSLETSH